MARKTQYVVYVEKAIMDRPTDLADAVMAHFIKRDVSTAVRKQFLVQFMVAPDAYKVKVIEEWVQVRDVATFPFRKDKGEVEVGGELTLSGELSVKKIERESDASEGAEGGVSVDSEQSDDEPEAGAAPDGSDTRDGQRDEGESGGVDGSDPDAVREGVVVGRDAGDGVREEGGDKT